MSSYNAQLKGIVRARSAAAHSLISALNASGSRFSEKTLSDNWLRFIQKEKYLFPFGWYQPPPAGLSVLIGTPPDYDRLAYRSLRDPLNFPSQNHSSDGNAIIYPYFSAIDRKSGMIGDHVATYYQGDDPGIREWMQQGYYLTKEIADSARAGMKISDLYHIATQLLSRINALNNTFSQSGGLSSDIGHSIPFFGQKTLPAEFQNENADPLLLSHALAEQRFFINAENHGIIESSCAFTIEPQLIVEGYPMASFHMIVVFVEKEKYIVEKFKDIFEVFGIDKWLYKSAYRSALS